MSLIEQIRAATLSDGMKNWLTAHERLMRVTERAGWTPEAGECLWQAFDRAAKRLRIYLSDAGAALFHLTQSIARGHLDRDAIRAISDTFFVADLLNDVFGPQAVRDGRLPTDQSAMMRLALAMTERFAALSAMQKPGRANER